MDPTADETNLVLVIRMKVDTTLLGSFPVFWDRLVLVGLVNNLGDDLGSRLDQARIRRRNVRAVNGIGGRILEQQRQESKDTSDEKCDNEDIDEDEDQDASTHDAGYNKGRAIVQRQLPRNIRDTRIYRWSQVFLRLSRPGGSEARRSGRQRHYRMQVKDMRKGGAYSSAAVAQKPRKRIRLATTSRADRRQKNWEEDARLKGSDERMSYGGY